jgi:uncharacterized protein YdeI (YjbR/CyaY-like superfamily)
VRPTFFETPGEFRKWLEEHHSRETELWVGFRKRASKLPSITWPESVEEALCFGWIDGVRKTIDESSYVIRFTPRKPGSTWSAVNIAKVAELQRAGRMRPAGEAAFGRRTEAKSGTYSYEQRQKPEFTPEQQRRFRANRGAWEFFRSQAPWYRRTATWWVISAKRAETQQKRLATLIADSAAGRRIKQLAQEKK